MSYSRRLFLKISLAFAALSSSVFYFSKKSRAESGSLLPGKSNATGKMDRLGTDDKGQSQVYISRNGTPEENMRKVLEMMGGIEEFIGPHDIVVLKPNAQWWNQGMTNTDAMQGFIDEVLAIPGFAGEVIIAENHQFDGANSRGWSTDERNGKFNLNELVEFYQASGFPNVTKYHWRVAGTTSLPLQGDAQGDSRVNGPQDGDGYVWLEDTVYVSPAGRQCVMTYPVFTSSYSGITVDLKHGAWKNGSWLPEKPVKFINFSALNHHGGYCGVTASIKNFMGVVDMSCGWPGDEPDQTFNTHHIGVSKINSWKKNKTFVSIMSRLRLYGKFSSYCYRDFHHTGGALGYFMRHVKMPTLNIITAERVGWGSRIDLEKSVRTKTILASKDPVALDYISARDIVLPITPTDLPFWDSGYTYSELNDPDNKQGPLYRFINEASLQGIGNFNVDKITLNEFYHG